MSNETPQVLTIAGADSSGGAGISADLKTFAAQGVYGANVFVALTAQNTLGVQDVLMTPPDMIWSQMQSIADDLDIKATKTGMLGNAETVALVAKGLQNFDFGKYVLDPVMVAKGGAKLLNPDAVAAVKSLLLPLTELVTPNMPEAEILSGQAINNRQDMQRAAKAIQKLGAKNVLLKGGHGQSSRIEDYVLLADGTDFWLASQRVLTERTHGTGDTISAAITAQLALGKTLDVAILHGKRYVDATIRDGIAVGHGHGPLNHGTKLMTEDTVEVLHDI